MSLANRLTMQPTTDLSALLDRLAEFEPTRHPFVSLYLNAQADQHGRDRYQTFADRELGGRAETYIDDPEARESLARDLDRIQRFLNDDLMPAANGVAIFACAGADLFETAQLAAPIGEHLLFIGDRPHLYPLARLDARYPRYAAFVCDTNRARIFVFAAGAVEKVDEVAGERTRRHDMGGWSQARFQRHIDNIQKDNIKDAVDALERIVREEEIPNVIITGNEAALPLIDEILPNPLRERVVDTFRLETKLPEHEVLERTLDALRRKEAETEREKVEAVVGAYRAGGLGVVGLERTRQALDNGQVDELLVSASLVELRGVHGIEAALAEADDAGGDESIEQVDAALRADEIVATARRTDAKIAFIEDAALLAPFGGVGASLRYRIGGITST
jgi:peptide chain release factor subunit 1